jgi:hypothetical protein
MGNGGERQIPDDKDWWMGKELPPTMTEQHPHEEDMGRCRQERRH